MIKSLNFKRIFIVLCLIGFYTNSDSTYAQFTDEEIIRTASSSLKSFLEKIPLGSEEQYGFANSTEINEATVGKPYRVYTIHPDSIKRGNPEGKGYMIPLDEWRLPVIVRDEYKALLTVTIVKNNLQVVDLGAKVLAREIRGFEKKHPQGQKMILRLFQLQCDFIILRPISKTLEQSEIYPLRSAGLMFQEFRNALDTPRMLKEILPKLHEKYLKGLGPDN